MNKQEDMFPDYESEIRQLEDIIGVAIPIDKETTKARGRTAIDVNQLHDDMMDKVPEYRDSGESITNYILHKYGSDSATMLEKWR